ncbi:MAG: hypothetical protein OIF57_11035, partial [Marinobacterium sp.]|nr:hypothetical protein [Marinobacterium sp.]
CDLPVSFTSELGDFLFDFAEKHIHCQKGDEILLLGAQLDVADILHREDFVSHFKQRVDSTDYMKGVSILKRRYAEEPGSAMLKQRIRTDLHDKYLFSSNNVMDEKGSGVN